MREAIRIELMDLYAAGASCRIRAQLIDAHPFMGAKAGEWITTSEVKAIDFERGIAYTRSDTIYLFEPVLV
jgi:hypothetical protein